MCIGVLKYIDVSMEMSFGVSLYCMYSCAKAFLRYKSLAEEEAYGPTSYLGRQKGDKAQFLALGSRLIIASSNGAGDAGNEV